MLKVSEFQIKDVVNVSDGKRLGNIEDIEINLNTGRIEAVIIGGAGKVLGLFGKDEEVVGEDVILVRFRDYGEIKEVKDND
jgi:YlmC/YmxH family sporulation protein